VTEIGGGGDGGRVVTQGDVDLVLESMIRRETGWLRNLGWAAEVIGWLTVASGLLVGYAQWDRFGGARDEFGSRMAWTEWGSFVLPSIANLAAAGIVAVVLGRGARLWALHQAARRGLNVTGLTLGEPLDLELEDD
jgi:hypothetical protein